MKFWLFLAKKEEMRNKEKRRKGIGETIMNETPKKPNKREKMDCSPVIPKSQEIALRPERFLDKPSLRGYSLNKDISRGFVSHNHDLLRNWINEPFVRRFPKIFGITEMQSIDASQHLVRRQPVRRNIKYN